MCILFYIKKYHTEFLANPVFYTLDLQCACAMHQVSRSNFICLVSWPFYHYRMSLCISVFKVYFIDCAITLVPLFLPFIPFCPTPTVPPPFPSPQFMSMGSTYKFFGFSKEEVQYTSILQKEYRQEGIVQYSYTILNLLLSILHLPFMLLIPCTFLPCSPAPLPSDNPSCDLYCC